MGVTESRATRPRVESASRAHRCLGRVGGPVSAALQGDPPHAGGLLEVCTVPLTKPERGLGSRVPGSSRRAQQCRLGSWPFLSRPCGLCPGGAKNSRARRDPGTALSSPPPTAGRSGSPPWWERRHREAQELAQSPGATTRPSRQPRSSVPERARQRSTLGFVLSMKLCRFRTQCAPRRAAGRERRASSLPAVWGLCGVCSLREHAWPL